MRARLLRDPFEQGGRANFCKDGFARDNLLPHHHFGIGPCGQVDVYTATKSDQAHSLAFRHCVARLHERHDTARHQSGDLRKADGEPVAAFDQNVLALIFFACLRIAGSPKTKSLRRRLCRVICTTSEVVAIG